MISRIPPHRPDASWSRFFVQLTMAGTTISHPDHPRWFEVDTSAVPDDRWAQCSVVLDEFHSHWALNPVEDFDVVVFDELGNMVSEDEANGRQHDVQGLFLGAVDRPDFRIAGKPTTADEEDAVDPPSPV